MAAAERAELLGLDFERIRTGDMVGRCLAWCHGPRRSHIVVTANASHLCMMRSDPALRESCQRADAAVADGMSVVWALRVLGRPVPERVAGIDLMTQLLQAASREGLRVYFLGARKVVLDTLLARCRDKYPGLVIAGYRDGYFGREQHEAIVEEIAASAPHVLFVGMPTPFKDVWCEQHRERLGVPVIIGVGGSFDVIAGYIKRAPRIAQSLGLEWAWRLLMEPRKLWKRYATTNTQFLWLVGKELLTRRAPGGGASPTR